MKRYPDNEFTAVVYPYKRVKQPKRPKPDDKPKAFSLAARVRIIRPKCR